MSAIQVGMWVGIHDSYRLLEGADKEAYYGEVIESSNGKEPFRVHCNSDKKHWFFENELRILEQPNAKAPS